MAEPVKISIITAVLNNAATVEATIRSVIEEGYSNLEYIIIDGGSTDGTLDIIHRYQASLARWVSEPDRGISDAFNKGLLLATGDVIGIVSADDWLVPGALTRVAQTYGEQPDTDVIYGNAVVLDPRTDKQFVIKPDIGLKTIWQRQSLKHAATFVARRTYEKYGLFDLQYLFAMDYDLILRFYVNGAEFVYVDYPLAAFRTTGVNARNPFRTFREVRSISIRYGYPPYKAYGVYGMKCLRFGIKYGLYHIGAGAVADLYRSRSRRFARYSSGT